MKKTNITGILTLTSLLIMSCNVSFPEETPYQNARISPSQPIVQDSLAPVVSPGAKPLEIILSTDQVVLELGNTAEVNASVKMDDNTLNSAAVYSSSDNSVVKVDNNGVITPLKTGLATVLVKAASSSLRASVQVTVVGNKSKPSLVQLTPTEATISVGETVNLQGFIRNSDGNITPNGRFSISNQSVATILGTGSTAIVTGVNPGKVTVTYTSIDDLTRVASSVIEVIEPQLQVKKE